MDTGEDAVGGALKYKTWVFKVLIHCEGCKKKVKKVLQAIDGVYETRIDSQQHKVMVTSSVDAETLIKKLTKSGKHVQLWPQLKPENKDKKPGKANGIDNQKDVGAEAAGDGNHDYLKNNNSADKSKLAASKNGGASAAAASKGSARDNQHPAGDQRGGKSEEPDPTQSANGAGNGAGNKKKKKKGQNSNPGIPNSETPPGSDTQSLPDHARPEQPIDLSPPNQPMYPYTPLLYGSPFCGVSYNTTCPSSTTSYYTPTMHYMPPATPSDQNDKSSEDYYHDDDNETGCSIM